MVLGWLGRIEKWSDDYTKERSEKPLEWFPKVAHGPIRATNTTETTTAVSPSGLTITLQGSDRPQDSKNTALLKSGIPIELDGSLIGHLYQDEHGERRSARVLAIRPDPDSNVLTSELTVRLRNVETVSLESESGEQLVSARGYRKAEVGAQASEMLVCLFAAVFHGFRRRVDL